MKDDLPFIEHILESIKAIEKFSKNMKKERLMSDRLRPSAIVREIEIIGEAVKNISKSLENKHSEIEWGEIAGTRDKMIHHYVKIADVECNLEHPKVYTNIQRLFDFGVDLNTVWDIIEVNIPDLKGKILKIREELNSEKN